jgi:hypothetical protein
MEMFGVSLTNHQQALMNTFQKYKSTTLQTHSDAMLTSDILTFVDHPQLRTYFLSHSELEMFLI